ncbi:MAG: DKNYY domain-containing protein [Spirochaetes bacterium]|nr:DKNYY domain-containing protein [Spirochaetota bacterium]
MRMIYILYVALIFILSCAGYKNDGKKITYSVSRSNHIAFGITKVEVKNADPASFEEMDDSRYGKDSNNVFFEGKQVSGADSKSFKIVGEAHACDNKRGYYEGVVISGSEGKSFREIDRYFSADSKEVYYLGKPLGVVAPDKFRYVFAEGEENISGGADDRWTTDGHYYFKKEVKVPSEDYEDVVIYKNEFIAKDKKWVYAYGNRLGATDKERKKFGMIDAATFEIAGQLEYPDGYEMTFKDKYGKFTLSKGRVK